jgi:hypothetical protein
MGYLIEMTDSNFIIRKENFTKALNSLKSVFVTENMTCYDSIDGERIPHFKWVSTKFVLDSKRLEDGLTGIRYLPIFNLAGDICDVEFVGEKYGDEKIFFSAIATYVEPGSFLCFVGEDGSEWKWEFNDGKVTLIE